MHSVTRASERTVAAAIRILGGEKAANIKIPSRDLQSPRYNWQQMQRWGISESRLPPESEIYFREPGVWEQYRLQIIGDLGDHSSAGSTDLLADLRAPAAVACRAPFAQRHDRAREHEPPGDGRAAFGIDRARDQPADQRDGVKCERCFALASAEKLTCERSKGPWVLTDIVGAGHQAREIVNSVRAMFKKEGRAKSRDQSQ